jgi:hypothetical protein
MQWSRRAPQFAINAADSSAGKFWEPNGFRRFLDETAVKLGRMYGDPHSAFALARMPIVIVAYSGGFGSTLSVLDAGASAHRSKRTLASAPEEKGSLESKRKAARAVGMPLCCDFRD